MAGPRHETIDDFLVGATHFPVVDEVCDELEEKAAAEPVDQHALRRQRDWSELNGQVVGGEA